MDAKKIIFAVVIILLIILLVRWYINDKNKLTGLSDATKVTKIAATDLAESNASNFAYSTWIYVNDWSYRYGEPKIILGRLDEDLKPSPSIVLGAIENNVQIQTTVYPSNSSNVGTTHKCGVANIPIQKWVNIIVSLYGRTLDVYIDGKLVRTCVLPGIAKIANDAPVYVTPLGGFSGYTSNTKYFGDALNPQEAYNIYKAGFGGGFGASFPYQVEVVFKKDGEEQNSFTI